MNQGNVWNTVWTKGMGRCCLCHISDVESGNNRVSHLYLERPINWDTAMSDEFVIFCLDCIITCQQHHAEPSRYKNGTVRKYLELRRKFEESKVVANAA